METLCQSVLNATPSLMVVSTVGMVTTAIGVEKLTSVRTTFASIAMCSSLIALNAQRKIIAKYAGVATLKSLAIVLKTCLLDNLN